MLSVSVTGPLTQEAVGLAALEDDEIELDDIVEDEDDMEEVWLALVLLLCPLDVLGVALDPLVVWTIEELDIEEPRVVEEVEDACVVDNAVEAVVIVVVTLLPPGT
jgi:hypothetical protein